MTFKEKTVRLKALLEKGGLSPEERDFVDKHTKAMRRVRENSRKNNKDPEFRRKRSLWSKKWWAKNKERLNEKQRAYKKALPKEKKTEWGAKRVAYAKKRRHSDPGFRVLHNMRSAVNRGFRGVVKRSDLSSAEHTKYFGCTYGSIKLYLESKFREGMSWENYGVLWQIDHIVPLKAAMGKYENLLKLCHFKNLQPLLAEENQSKKDKMPEVWPEGVPFTREEVESWTVEPKEIIPSAL